MLGEVHACYPAWSWVGRKGAPRRASSCPHPAWEPSACERAACDTDTCVLELWRRCLDGGGARGACPCKADCSISNASSVVWVTLLNGNSPNYTLNVIVQALSVRLFSCHEHVTLVTPEVRHSVREQIRDAGRGRVQEVETIRWPHAPSGVAESYGGVFSKLHAWNMTAYSRVLLLDSDALLLRPRADRILAHCTSAAAGLCAGREGPEGSGLNSGVLAIRPSSSRFEGLLRAMRAFEHPNPRFMDQNFLNVFFKANSRKPAWWRARGLEYFNADAAGRPLPPAHAGNTFQSCPRYARLPFFYDTARASRQVIERFAIWHACGVHKLDRFPTCPVGPTGADCFCSSRVLRLYQWLKARANPCAAHAARLPCEEAKRGTDACLWCGDSTRCITARQGCHADDAYTRANELRARQPRGRSRYRPGKPRMVRHGVRSGLLRGPSCQIVGTAREKRHDWRLA